MCLVYNLWSGPLLFRLASLVKYLLNACYGIWMVPSDPHPTTSGETLSISLIPQERCGKGKW